MIASEKRVGRKNKGYGYPSSKTLNDVGDMVVTTKKKLRSESIKKVKDAVTIEAIKKDLTINKKLLKQVQRESIKHREQELDQLAKKRAEQWNIKAAQAIIVIKASEE